MCLCVPEGSIWRLPSSFRSSRRGLSAHCASRPKYTRHFTGLFFLPQWGTGSMFLSGGGRQRLSASPVLCPLSCFLLHRLHRANYGSRCRMVRLHAVYHRRLFLQPCASVLHEVVQRVDCDQARTHKYPSLVGGFHAQPEPTSSLLQVHSLPTLIDGMLP